MKTKLIKSIPYITNLLLYALVTYIVIFISTIYAINTYTGILQDMGYVQFEKYNLSSHGVIK